MLVRIKKIMAFSLFLVLCSCSGVSFTDWHFPYMMEVQQGTYITDHQFQQLKVGMSKEQVVFVLGYPLSQALFDKNRWDFDYQDYKNNSLKRSYSVTFWFDKNANVTQIKKTGDDLFTN